MTNSRGVDYEKRSEKKSIGNAMLSEMWWAEKLNNSVTADSTKYLRQLLEEPNLLVP